LLPSVRRDLEAGVEKELDRVEEKLKEQLLGIVKLLSLKLVNTFQTIPPHSTAIVENPQSPEPNVYPLNIDFEPIQDSVPFDPFDYLPDWGEEHVQISPALSLELSTISPAVSDPVCLSNENTSTSLSDEEPSYELGERV
jgi:hypothetical protein